MISKPSRKTALSLLVCLVLAAVMFSAGCSNFYDRPYDIALVKFGGDGEPEWSCQMDGEWWEHPDMVTPLPDGYVISESYFPENSSQLFNAMHRISDNGTVLWKLNISEYFTDIGGWSIRVHDQILLSNGDIAGMDTVGRVLIIHPDGELAYLLESFPDHFRPRRLTPYGDDGFILSGEEDSFAPDTVKGLLPCTGGQTGEIIPLVNSSGLTSKNIPWVAPLDDGRYAAFVAAEVFETRAMECRFFILDTDLSVVRNFTVPELVPFGDDISCFYQAPDGLLRIGYYHYAQSKTNDSSYLREASVTIDGEFAGSRELAIGGIFTPSPDGGYVYAVLTRYPDGGYTIARLQKVDATGEVEWKVDGGRQEFDEIMSVVATPDGGYLVAGNVRVVRRETGLI